MKSKNIIIIVAVVVVLAGMYYSFSGAPTSEAYIARIEQLRSEKDNTMRSGDDSPFVRDSVEFTGLNYFPIDESYRINATLTPIEHKKAVVLPTSDGAQKTYLEYAYAEFEMKGEKNKLLIFEIMDMGPYHGTLFLAFADNTSAVETYGAGRYLDLKKVPGSTSITLDFNEAYNPYCAYTDSYSCPFPPPENILKIAIQAGEKTYH